MPTHRPSNRCSSCHRDAVVRPHAAWTLALVGGYVVLGAMVFGASLLGPTIMAVLPLLAATGMGLLPFLHERAGAPATCSACGRYQPTEGHAPSEAEASTLEVARAA